MKVYLFLVIIFALQIFLGISVSAKATASWFTCYPIGYYTQEDTDKLLETGAKFITFPVGGSWAVRPEKDRYDFENLEKQIKFLYDNDLRGSLIAELNPLFGPYASWLPEELGSINQLSRGVDGNPTKYPAFSSEVFLTEQEKTSKAIVEYIDQNDPEGRVEYIHPGAEWWFMPTDRYGDPDKQAFKLWLSQKYKDIKYLNERWDSNYKTFDEVDIPIIDISIPSNGAKGIGFASDINFSTVASWFNKGILDKESFDYTANTEYLLKYDVKIEDIKGTVYAECAFSNSTVTALSTISGTEFINEPTNGWVTVEQKIKAPMSISGKGYILLKLEGRGKAFFDNVSLVELSSKDENLLKGGDFEPESEKWGNVTWSGKDDTFYEYVKEDNRNVIKIETVAKSVVGYKNLEAANYDSQIFWFEHGADYINKTHGFFKKYDTKRKQVIYMTMAFCFGAEWDLLYRAAVSPDYIALAGTNIDEIGLQICSADGDDHRITTALDLTRKYEKRLWAVDLIDFTSGALIDNWYINKMTQNAVATGAEGLVYCGYKISFMVDDYSYDSHHSSSVLKQILNNAEIGAKEMENHSFIKEVALIAPLLPASSNDSKGYKNSPFSFMGLYKILKYSNFNVDIITFKDIEANPKILENYKFAVVPDCAYVPLPALEIIHNNKNVFYAGNFGLFDEIGNPIDKKYKQTGFDYGFEYTGVLTRDTHAGNTPPLLLWGEETKDRKAVRDEGIKALRDFASKCNVENIIEQEGFYTYANKLTGENTNLIYFVNQINPKDLPEEQSKAIKINLENTSFSKDKKNYYFVIDGIKTEEFSILSSSIEIPAFDTTCIFVLK